MMNAPQQVASALPSTFGKCLRTGRIRAGLSQDELALKLGVSQQTVAKWERGTAAPRGENRAAVAQVLGLTFEDEADTGVDVPKESGIQSELLMAELIIITMHNALTIEQRAMVQAHLDEAGISGSDAVRSQERRAAILAGGAA